jgi:hypothetical protein
MKKLLLVVALLVLPHTANADAMTYGQGIQSCGIWTTERNKGDSWAALVNQAWVLGFITAIDMSLQATRDRMLKRTDTVAMTSFIDNYCAANPLKSIELAALDLVSKLLTNKPTKEK